MAAVILQANEHQHIGDRSQHIEIIISSDHLGCLEAQAVSDTREIYVRDIDDLHYFLSVTLADEPLNDSFCRGQSIRTWVAIEDWDNWLEGYEVIQDV